MSVVSELEIRLFAGVARLQQDMDRARQTVNGAMERISASVGNAKQMIAGFAAGLTVGVFVNFVKGAIDAVDALNDLSARTKVGIEDLAGLAYGAKLSDTSLEGVAASISKLSQNIGKDSAKFRELGITATEPLEAFKQLADVFKGIQDPQQRAAFGAEALGKSWQEAAVLLEGGSEGIAELIDKGKDLSGITEQVATDAGAFNDKLDELGFAAQGLGTRIAAGLLPTLNQIVTAMDSSDVSGEKLTGTIDVLGGALKLLYTIGVTAVGVFSTLGKAIGAAAAMTVQTFSGDFAGAWQTYKELGADVADSWVNAARRVDTAWSTASTGAIEAVTDWGDAVADTSGKVSKFLNSGEISAARKKATDEAMAFYSKTRDASIDHLMQLEAERDGQVALSAEEKKRIEILNDLLKFGKNLTEQQRADIQGWAEAVPLLAKYNKELEKTKSLREQREGEAFGDVASAHDQTQALKDQIAYYGLAEDAVLKLKAVEIQRGLDSGYIDDIERGRLKGLLDATNEQIQLQGKLASMNSGSSLTQAKELLDILVAVDNAAKSAAQGMAASFGTVGAAIGGLTTALTDYAVQQQAVAAQLAAVKADPKSSADKIAKAEMAASKASAQAQIKSYGDMAAAGKGFFKENSKGYKLMETTERAFRAYEMAMAVESMVKKIFFKEGEVAANLALNATKLTGEATTTSASVALAGTEASAWGITAVVKAMASLPFPLNLAAGAVTLAAVLALGAKVMGGGGGGMSVSQQRQESQGTGSVFGDSTAKSDSIKRSMDLVASNSSIELSYTQGMLNSLRSIESSMSGLGNLLVRTSGLTGVVEQASSGGWLGKIGNSIFGGKTTVEDTGFKIDPTTFARAMAGDLNSFQYTDTKKSGGWFSSDKKNTSWNALGADADAQFAKVIIGLGASIGEAASLLGVGGDAFTQRLNGFVIDIGKISLKGLSGAEIQEQLEAVFSKLGDDMARFGVAGLDQFQQVGEGYFETLTRIASNYANLDSILASSSTSFGQIGMSSIAARERLIALAGGIDELASAQASFNDNFLTEAERLAPVQKYVTDQLAAMGLQSLDTRDKFKDYVLGLANSGKLATEAGAAQYTALLALADAFAKTHAATVDLSKSEQEIADQRTDLQNQLDELTMTQAQLAAKARKDIDTSNLKLYDELTARKALAAAYETQSDALKTSIEKLTTFSSAIKSFRDGLVLGNLSTLTLAEKAAAARDQYSTTLGAARAGDATAQSGLSAAATAFLTASQAGAASRLDYVRDYARVQADMAILAVSVGSQLTDAEKQQASLDKQVKGLITINDSVNAGAATVAQAIASLGVLGVKQIDGSHAGGLSHVPFDGYTAELHSGERVLTAFEAREYSAQSNSSGGGNSALLAEIKGLREDNRVLTAKVDEFMRQSQAGDIAMVQNTGKIARLADRWDSNGLLVRADESIPTREVVTA